MRARAGATPWTVGSKTSSPLSRSRRATIGARERCAFSAFIWTWVGRLLAWISSSMPRMSVRKALHGGACPTIREPRVSDSLEEGVAPVRLVEPVFPAAEAVEELAVHELERRPVHQASSADVWRS
jgi:hypothetical protein